MTSKDLDDKQDQGVSRESENDWNLTRVLNITSEKSIKILKKFTAKISVE